LNEVVEGLGTAGIAARDAARQRQQSADELRPRGRVTISVILREQPLALGRAFCGSLAARAGQSPADVALG
jgi:hypothetical protein